MIKRIKTEADARAALAAGARWLHLTDAAELEAVIPVARDAEAILTLQSDHERVLQTLIHGVILSAADAPAADVREKLGPHAIIGCEVSSLFEVMRLAPLDVDFFVLTASADQAGEIITLARRKGVEQRFVTLTPVEGADAVMND